MDIQARVDKSLATYHKMKSTKGISLMETVVYVSLVAFVLVLVAQSVLMLVRTFKEIRSTRDIGNSAIVALDRIAKEVRQADALGTGGVFGTATSKLVLLYSGPPAITMEFSLDSNRSLRLIEDGIDIGALTSAGVSVESFWIDQATTGTKTAFRFVLILKDKRNASSGNVTFYGAASMRGLY